MPDTTFHTFESPIGILGIKSRDDFLVSITFLDEDASETDESATDSPPKGLKKTACHCEYRRLSGTIPGSNSLLNSMKGDRHAPKNKGLAMTEKNLEVSQRHIVANTKKQFEEYFAGNRHTFDLPLKPDGTDFQKLVWEQLSNIPYGQTTTYGALANAMGDHKKVRAIGHANGQNPLPIIIPCHRVIGSDNKLIGYAGGVERKRWLLQHEGAFLL